MARFPYMNIEYKVFDCAYLVQIKVWVSLLFV